MKNSEKKKMLPRLFFFIGWVLIFFSPEIHKTLGLSYNAILLPGIFFVIISMYGIKGRVSGTYARAQIILRKILEKLK